MFKYKSTCFIILEGDKAEADHASHYPSASSGTVFASPPLHPIHTQNHGIVQPVHRCRNRRGKPPTHNQLFSKLVFIPMTRLGGRIQPEPRQTLAQHMQAIPLPDTQPILVIHCKAQVFIYTANLFSQ